VPTFPDPTPAECEWLRDRMRAAASTGESEGTGGNDDAGDTGGGERVYVARGDATVRRVANRDELQGVLDRYDIDTYLPGELSVREQVALFSRADLVVGPHGAGLTNVVFGEDLAVIELFGDKQIATFDRLAAALGHGYEYLEGEGVGVDIRVDTDALDRTIARVLEGEPADRTGS